MRKTPANQELFELVCHLLTTTRTLTAPVAAAIVTRLEVYDALEGLASEKMANLEEYEAELLLSSLFTPKDSDREVCEQALSTEGLTPETIGQLTHQLCQANLTCPVVHGVDTGTLALPDIVIERYVQLLGLELSIPEPISTLLENLVDIETRYRTFALIRRPVWQDRKNCQVLVDCLEKMREKQSFSVGKVDFLTHFVRTYRADEISLLLDRLVNMVDAYRRDKEHPIYSRNLADKQEHSLMPLSCNQQVRADRVAMASALLVDFDRTPPRIDFF